MKVLFIDTVHMYLKDSLTKAGHVCMDGSKFSREEILKNIHEYDGVVVRSRIQMDKELLDAAVRLKFIARAGSGMESVDVKYAEMKKIVCLNSPEGNRDAVGEHAIGMLLSLLNNLNKADREVRAGKWEREGNRGVELQGKTVGIIGYGNMGKAVAKKLSGFDVQVLAYDKYLPALKLRETGLKNYSDEFAKEISLEKLFEETDILSLHVPLTAETEYMVNDAFIKRFRKNIYLVNTARGKVVKTDDLVKNMKAGKVLGACLDTIEYEDTSFEKFEIRDSKFEIEESWQYLIHSDRVVLSPHIAGWTVESNEKISKVLYKKISSLRK